MMIAKSVFVILSGLLALSNCDRLPSPLANPCLSESSRIDDVMPDVFFFGQSETIETSQVLDELITSMREAKHAVNEVKEALEESSISNRLIRQLWGRDGHPEAGPEIDTTFTQRLKFDYNETAKTWLILNTLEYIVNVPHATPVIRRCKEKMLTVLCKLRDTTQAEDEEMPAPLSESYRVPFTTLRRIRAYFQNTIRLYTHYRLNFPNRNEGC